MDLFVFYLQLFMRGRLHVIGRASLERSSCSVFGNRNRSNFPRPLGCVNHLPSVNKQGQQKHFPTILRSSFCGVEEAGTPHHITWSILWQRRQWGQKAHFLCRPLLCEECGGSTPGIAATPLHIGWVRSRFRKTPEKCERCIFFLKKKKGFTIALEIILELTP